MHRSSVVGRRSSVAALPEHKRCANGKRKRQRPGHIHVAGEGVGLTDRAIGAHEGQRRRDAEAGRAVASEELCHAYHRLGGRREQQAGDQASDLPGPPRQRQHHEPDQKSLAPAQQFLDRFNARVGRKSQRQQQRPQKCAPQPEPQMPERAGLDEQRCSGSFASWRSWLTRK